jgi:hypothetical protein
MDEKIIKIIVSLNRNEVLKGVKMPFIFKWENDTFYSQCLQGLTSFSRNLVCQ